MYYLTKFSQWLLEHFLIRGIFTPIYVINRRIESNYGFSQCGYQYIYVFGIRIAKIQKTIPWN